MNKLIPLIFLFLIGCLSYPTKKEIIELDKKILDKTFDYSIEQSDIDVILEVVNNDLVGKLFKKEQVTYQIKKKEITKFDNSQSADYWFGAIVYTIGSFGVAIPFLVYGYIESLIQINSKDSEKIYEEKEIRKNKIDEFNPNQFSEASYSVLLNKRKKIKITNSSFTVPLDYFMNQKEINLDYAIYLKNTEVQAETVSLKDNKITGTSPKYEQLLTMIEIEEKKRKIAEERERDIRLKREEKERQASNQKKAIDKENENKALEEFIYENNAYFPDLKECDFAKGIEINEKRGYKDACQIGSPNTGYSNGARFNKQIFFFCISKYDKRKTGKGISFFHNSNGEWGKDKSKVACLNE
ncbi:MAG: hypothetical protein KA146_03115 [Leptospiraceae bacterium]|nr:hypothetical protein [Leptospiraceae bacterium]